MALTTVQNRTRQHTCVLIILLCCTVPLSVTPAQSPTTFKRPPVALIGLGSIAALAGITLFTKAYHLSKPSLQRFNRYLNTLPLPLVPMRGVMYKAMGQWIDGVVCMALKKFCPKPNNYLSVPLALFGTPVFTYWVENWLSQTGTNPTVSPEIASITGTMTSAFSNPKNAPSRSWWSRLFSWPFSTALPKLSELQKKALSDFLGLIKDEKLSALAKKWQDGENVELAYLGIADSCKKDTIIEVGRLLSRTVIVLDARNFKSVSATNHKAVTKFWEQLVKDRLTDGSIKKGDIILFDNADLMVEQTGDYSSDTEKSAFFTGFQDFLHSKDLNFAWTASCAAESLLPDIGNRLQDPEAGTIVSAQLASTPEYREQICQKNIAELTDTRLAKKLANTGDVQAIKDIKEWIAKNTPYCLSTQIASLCERCFRTRFSSNNTVTDIKKIFQPIAIETYTTTLSMLESKMQTYQKNLNNAKYITQKPAWEKNVKDLQTNIDDVKTRITTLKNNL
jgi:hypothetical protein